MKNGRWERSDSRRGPGSSKAAATCASAKSARDARLALMDAGVSDNTRDKFSALCAGKNVPLRILPEDALGSAIGQPGRMVAVLKEGPLTTKLESLLS